MCERFAWEGLEAALVHRQPKNTKLQEARWRAGGAFDRSACSEPPKGKKRWSVRLLAERFVRRRQPRSPISRELVRRTLKKSAIKPRLSGQWSIPPKQNASFVWRTARMLEVYTRPYDERFLQVFDEKAEQTTPSRGEGAPRPPAQDGQPAKTTSTSATGQPTSS